MEPRKNQTATYYFLLKCLPAFCVVAMLVSCGNNGKQKLQNDLDQFKTYVQNHKDSVDRYVDQNWDELDAEYQLRKAELDKSVDKMDEAMQQSYQNTLNEWNNFKTDYVRTTEGNSKMLLMDQLRATLVIDGVRSDYTDLTAKDIVREYEHFVNTVKASKDIYTKEQWLVINVNYKALNGRKREIKKDVSNADLNKIVNLQLEYTGIKAMNRPFADDLDDK